MSGTLVDLGVGHGSSVEALKLQSAHLRGTLDDALAADTPNFGEDDAQLLKFHGSYQQEDRDRRRERKAEGAGKAYQFMLRTRIPGGVVTARQYLAHDDLAGRYANGTLRVTTRQGLQLHGVLKGDLRETIRGIDAALLTTFAACGDVNRNVMACPAPAAGPAHAEVQAFAHRIAERLTPRSRAYHDIWIDGEKLERAPDRDAAADHEPIYGPTYLPRKFKIAVALPNDNCVDVLTNDLGLIAELDGDALAGFTVVVGGGMGRTHGKSETYPRLATPLCFATPAEVLDVIEAVVTTQRDFGDRTNRKHARLKYVVEERGIDWVRGEVERRLGRRLADPHRVALSHVDDHLGWTRAADGSWFVGIFIENGRIKDAGDVHLRTGLRRAIARFGLGVRFTGQQNALLTDIAESDRAAVAALLAASGIATEPAALDVRRDAMACPALPTCGLALADAERALPSVMDRLAAELAALGIGERRIGVRMTGCPNGCARPYMGDVGLVGRSKDLYDVFLGGDAAGTRMNWLYASAVRTESLIGTLAPLLRAWRDEGNAERFGDWCDRYGRAGLLALTQATAV